MSDRITHPSDHRITLSREEEADAALRHTSLTPAMGWFLCVFFILTIVAVPVIQAAVETHRNLQARQEPGSSGGSGKTSILPQVFDVLSLIPSAKQMEAVRTPQDAWALLPPVKSIREFENALEQKSLLTEWLLPRTQAVLTGLFGLGNEQAFCGQQHWLFYRPDVEYLTGGPFLDPAVLRTRERSGDEATARVQPDPIKAIVRFKQQLAERGIDLIVMPAPLKPVVHPELLSNRYEPSATALQNPSYRPFLDELAKQGVQVFDSGDLLARAAQETNTPQYLRTDTHWTPPAMDLAAQELVRFIGEHEQLPALDPVAYTRQPVTVSNLGDIAVMLKLPEDQTLYPKQTVTIQQVMNPDGSGWQPGRDADVLLLGDSFSNIYSLGGMDWGEGAGFAEQLSYYLHRPLDKIVVNAGGAYSSRQRLVEEMTRGKDRLAGKRLVIYEFAMRDLSSGDWKLLDLPKPAAPAPAPTPPATSDTPPVVTPPVTPPIPTPANPTPSPPGQTTGNPVSTGPLIARVPRGTTGTTGTGRNTGQVFVPAQPFTPRPRPQFNNGDPPPVPQTTGTVPLPPRNPPVPPAHPPVRVKPPAPGILVVQGTVKSVAAPPRPGTVAYKDCIIGVRLIGVRAVSGGASPPDIVVYVWGMKDNRLTEASTFAPGQTLTFALQPWDHVENTYGGYNRRELDDSDAMTLDAYWGEIRR